MVKLLTRNILFFVLMTSVVIGLGYSPLKTYLHSGILYILLFFFLSSLLISWMMDLSTRDKGNFIILSLGATVLRMLVTIFAIIIGLVAGVDDQSLFIINFFGIYLFYLIFELIFVLSNLRTN